MGTKRPYDEDLQEFLKYPNHLENGCKPDSFGQEKEYSEPSQNAVIVGEGGEKMIVVPDMVEKAFEISAPLSFVTGITGREEASGPGLGPTFCSNFFSDFFESNIPRQSLVHYDDTYSSLLNCSPRKEIPIGPEHQAIVPEFHSDSARYYISQNGREKTLMGVCVISNQEDETVIAQTDCKCMDNGSIRCVQQHVNEARLNLKESIGPEKFINLGFNSMGEEEVACNWAEEEQRFHDIIYSNPVSHGKKFWEVLSVEFPTRSKKELVSYYFNVFIYRRRAVQNRSQLLAIDSDDDEWWGTRRGSSGVAAENEDLVVGGLFVDHGDHDRDSSSENGDTVAGVKENQLINGSTSSNMRDDNVTSHSEQEKPAVANNTGLKSESYLHWDPPYSTMGSTKGVDLLPTCNMIEEIFGSSGKSS